MAGQFQVSNPYHSQGIAAGGSALLDAINKGKVHLAKFILDAGECDTVNTRDFKGKTPLIRACYIKEEKTRGRAVKLLLFKGACVNIQDNEGRTALSYACQLRCNDVVKTLVQNNVNPDLPDFKGNTPLMYSAMVGNDTAIEILAKCFRRLGLNVDHVNDEGVTALIIAAKNGFIECASILSLEGRACISFRDPDKGYTAEEWAVLQGCSTEEVLPFSSTLALWQYRMTRKPSMPPEPEELQLLGEVRTEEGQRSFVVERTTEKNTELVDVDELSKLLARSGMGGDLKVAAGRDEVGALKKRCSLPAIKFKATQVSLGGCGGGAGAGGDAAGAGGRVGAAAGAVRASVKDASGELAGSGRRRCRAGSSTPSVPERPEVDTTTGPEVGRRKRVSVGTQTDVGDPTRSRNAAVVLGAVTSARADRNCDDPDDRKSTSDTLETEGARSTSAMSLASDDDSAVSFSGSYNTATKSERSSVEPPEIGLDLRYDIGGSGRPEATTDTMN